MMEEQDVVRLDRTNAAVVVDSTADLSEGLAADPNLSMVPLNVHFGEETFKDWIDIQPQEFYRRLKSADRLPTTSQPSAGAFIEEYKRLRTQFEFIFSIHLSAKLSGTFESASVAQAEVSGVTVIDSEMASLAVGLLARQVLGLIDRGTTKDEILAYVERYRREAGRLFLLSTLEYLQKGGRIGRASGLAGSLLNIKPLLTFEDGIVHPYKKVRGESKALAAVQEYFLEKTKPGVRYAVAVAHADAPSKVDEIIEVLKKTDRDFRVVLKGQVGSVIGTYAGPEAVALFFVDG
ncbi:MAG: DegV family protein [Thermoleophilia bacterium]|jgi:DegV family protein with EDD domain